MELLKRLSIQTLSELAALPNNNSINVLAFPVCVCVCVCARLNELVVIE
jgi:hypothetical protein